jgi:hypothetical protein
MRREAWRFESSLGHQKVVAVDPKKSEKTQQCLEPAGFFVFYRPTRSAVIRLKMDGDAVARRTGDVDLAAWHEHAPSFPPVQRISCGSPPDQIRGQLCVPLLRDNPMFNPR